MRRLLSLPLLFAAALIVAGCGGSSSDSVPHPGIPSVASLKGQYIFQEQVYTYLAGGVALHTGGSNGPKLAPKQPLTHVDSLPRIAQRAASFREHASQRTTHQAAGKGAKPEQGEQYASNVAFGAEIGSLTFDGNGNVTAGELDFNEPLAGGYYSTSVTGTYTVASDQTGTITLQGAGANSGDTFAYAITLQNTTNGSVATGAELIEGFTNGANTEIGTGQLIQQTSGAVLSGNYVFGIQGQTCYGCTQATTGDVIAAGLLATDGAGNFTASSQADIATGFVTNNQVGLTGTYGAPDANGRSTATLTATGYTNGTLPAGYVIYTADSGTAYILSTDQTTSTIAASFLYGQLAQQSGTFSSGSLAGNYVVAETTEDLANETISPDTFSDASLALLTATGGTLDGTGDINAAGNIASNVAFNYGNYTIAANGRVTLSGTTPMNSPAPVFWLQNSSFGFGVDQLNGTASQEPGLLYLYQQSGSGFTNATLTGTYALGNLPSATSNVGIDVNGNEIGLGFATGALTADGNGNISGNGSTVYIDGDLYNGTLTGTYTVASDGRGTITGSGSNGLLGNEVFYITGSNQALAFDITSGNTAPAIQVVHK